MDDWTPQEHAIAYVCEVPKELGRVIKLEAIKGKVVARTESGITMVVPTNGTR